ncbi:coilin-like [Paramuricea clavata]|uniref:Coilin-like n=1 Tax=Paramuricea clavata TaxID=317549 RepID=A0A6S7H9K3_PARCT|nr:coilin-like [Paramuricea clavata]
MSSVRVKLIFERPLVKSPEQCWMLVDKSSCKMVHDLEYLIVKKFFVAGHTILNLFLDDFLLPSKEKIDVIRDNDVIRVVEDNNNILSNENSEKTSSKEKIRSSKKRKYEESCDSKRKIKKAKHSSDKNLTAENNIDGSITDKQPNSNLVVTNDSRTTQSSLLHNIHKEKNKNKNTENVNTISNKNSLQKGDSIAETKTKQKKLKKRHKKPSKDKSIATKLNSFWDKLAGSRNQWNPTFSTKKLAEPETTQTVTAKDNGINLAGSADKERMQDPTVNGKVQENNGDSLSKGKSNNKEIPNRIENGTPRTSQGNHIRFDNEEDNNSVTEVLNNAMLPLAHPRVLSIRGANTPCPNGTPNLSPIEPHAQNGFSANKSVNGSDKVNNHRGGKGGKRKDSYTNTSRIMESTRVEKDTQPQESLSVTVDTPEKDFSVYPLLHGPPRIGDTVAYKVQQ